MIPPDDADGDHDDADNADDDGDDDDNIDDDGDDELSGQQGTNANEGPGAMVA